MSFLRLAKAHVNDSDVFQHHEQIHQSKFQPLEHHHGGQSVVWIAELNKAWRHLVWEQCDGFLTLHHIRYHHPLLTASQLLFVQNMGQWKKGKGGVLTL
jgi:hypothetical protein